MLGATGQARLSSTGLYQLKWLLGNALALIGVWSMLPLQLVSLPLLSLLIFGLSLLLIVPRIAGMLMNTIGKALAPVVVVFVVVDISLNFIALVEPMARMVLLLVVLRALQYRSRREDLQLLLLALFMLILSGVLTVSLLFAAQIIVFSPLAMGLLFIVNLSDSNPQPELTLKDWDDFKWRRFVPKIWVVLDFKMLSIAGVLFVFLVTVSSIIFVLMPRFNFGQSLSFMEMQVAGKKGFSDKIEFGDVSELADDNAVALRVEPPRRDLVPATPYWRMIVLDEYQYGTFSLSVSARNAMASRLHLTNTFAPGFNHDALLQGSEAAEDAWVFYLEGDVSRFLPMIGPFDVIRFPKQTKFVPFPELSLIELTRVNSNVLGYSVDGFQVGMDIPASRSEIAALKDALPVVPTFDAEGKLRREQYPKTTLVLPHNAEDRTYLEGVVAAITRGNQLGFEAFRQRTISYLHSKYNYETSLGALSEHGAADPLLHWMRGAETGWCEHFAGAFILLARTAGFPARAVTGFTGAAWNDYENYLVVRNNHAHAWVEVFDEQTNLWRRVDPTPVALPGGGQADAALAQSVVSDTGMNAWLDSLRMVWYRRVVNFDRADQEQMLQDIRDFGQTFVTEIKATVFHYWNAVQAWFHGSWGMQKILLMIAVLVSMGLSVFVVKNYQSVFFFFWNIWYRSHSREAVHPARRQAGKWLVRLKPLLYAANTQDDESQSSHEISDVYKKILMIRYGESIHLMNTQALFKQAKRVIKKHK